MQPGRELDALVAEKVFGLPVVWTSSPPYGGFEMKTLAQLGQYGRLPYLKGSANGVAYDWAKVPQYSTDPGDALNVLEHTKLLDDQWVLYQDGGRWCISPYEREDHYIANFSTNTFAHVVCLAALKAVGHEIEDPHAPLG